MRRLLLSVIFLWILIPVSLSGSVNLSHISYDSCLFRHLSGLLPDLNGRGKAEILLIMAGQISDTLPDQSLILLEKAFRIAVQESDIVMKARIRKMMGECFWKKQKYDLALVNFQASLKISKQIEDYETEIPILVVIGMLNRDQKDYSSASRYFQLGLDKARLHKSKLWTSDCLNQMAITMQLKGDFIKAKQLYFEALSEIRPLGNKQLEISILNNLGSIYIEKKQYDSALLFYKKALPEIDKMDGFLQGNIFTRIAHIYSLRPNLKKSLEWNRKAFKIREQYNDHQNVASSLINMAGDLFLLDCPDSAFFYLNQGLLLAGKYGQQNLIENAYRHVYRYYLKKGDYRKALENYRQYTFLSDSILKLRNQGNISIIEANLSIINIEESNKLLVEQNKIQSLHLSNQKTQYILMRVLVALGIILIIFILFQYSSIRRARKSKQDLYYLLTREKSESEKIQQQTRKRELQYRFLTENTIDFITHLNNKNKRIYASPSSLQMFGFTPDEMLKRSSYDICHLDFIKQSEQTFSEMLETRREKQFVYRTQKKNGSYFWVESILNPIFDPSTGEFKEIVGVTRDINERKNIELEIMESTRQKVNLLKEIHHRVKNNFAILVSLINMQIDQSKNPEVIQSLSNLQLRIRTMALVHEMLYRSKDFEKISFPDYLRSLVSVVAGSFNRRDIQTIIETEDAFLDIGSSIPVGLIINEVMSNTYMHAFPGERSGNVRILLKKQPDSPSITLIIHDDGIGLPDSFSLEQVRTMGLQIVQILSRQLEADVILKNDEGTLFSLCFKCKADQ